MRAIILEGAVFSLSTTLTFPSCFPSISSAVTLSLLLLSYNFDPFYSISHVHIFFSNSGL